MCYNNICICIYVHTIKYITQLHSRHNTGRHVMVQTIAQVPYKLPHVGNGKFSKPPHDEAARHVNNAKWISADVKVFFDAWRCCHPEA